MPKSGSHILSQFLEGVARISSLIYTDIHPVRAITAEGRIRPEQEILADLTKLHPGDMAWGYLRATDAVVEELAKDGRRVFFAYRDPRDAIVSHIIYALEMYPGHRLRGYYRDHLDSMEARISATIRGFNEHGYSFPDVQSDYERYLPWLDHPNTMPVRFEDFIHRREQTLDRMLDHLQNEDFQIELPRGEAHKILNRAMDPERSPTFRKGKTGGWRDHFSAANKREFKEVAGDLLIRLGYERDNDW